MKATDVLRQEHRQIEKGLDDLSALCDRAEKEGKIPLDEAQLVLAFLRNYADRSHHQKEESILFPRAVERGMPKFGGALEVLEAEHEEGRAHIRALVQALESNGPADFVARGRQYVQLLRGHILTEDEEVFPMIEEHLSPADTAELLGLYLSLEDELHQEAPASLEKKHF
ncbi:MAG: hemerythrin domain-containing protein [Acidobacteria bacterium]|nr:hemerythrin domain-containing protein [Acidobacteriota bacterium]